MYGTRVERGRVWYFVFEDEEDPYPVPRPAPFFEIIDPKPSAEWKVGRRIAENRKGAKPEGLSA